MANEITIKFKADGDQSLIKAVKALDRETKSLINTQAKIASANAKTTDSTKKYNKGLFELGHSARQTGGAFSVMRSNLLLFNFAMGLGIRQLLKFTELSNQVEAMSRAFNTLQGGTNNASISLEKLQKATNGTMKSFDLFQQANNAMILGVSKNSDEMAEMFDIAQRLGHALGKDTRMSVESLITGIGRQSRLMLDNIGIIVKSDEAYQSYADEIGKTVDKLTDAEKKQAFLTATMDSARKKVSGLGEEYIDNAMAIQQLSVSVNEVSIRIGETLSPIVIGMSQHLKEFADSLDSEKLRMFGSILVTATGAFVTYKSAVLLAIGANRLFALSLVKTGVGALIVGIGSALAYATDQIYKNKLAYMELSTEIDDHIRSIKGVKKELKNLNEIEEERDKRIKKHMEEANKAVKARKIAIEEEIALLKLGEEERKKIIEIRSKVEKRLLKFEEIFGKESVKKRKHTFEHLATLEIEHGLLKEKIRKDEEEAEANNANALFFTAKAFRDKLNQDEIDAETSLNELRKNQHEVQRNNREIRNNKILEQQKKLNKNREEERNNQIDQWKKINQFKLEKSKEFTDAEKIIFANNINFQLDLLDKQKEKFEKLGFEGLELDQFIADSKKEIVLKNLEETDALYRDATATYDQFIQSLVDLEMTGKDRREKIWSATRSSFIRFLGEMLKEQIKNKIASSIIESASQAESVAKSKATGVALASNYSVPAGLSTIATGGSSALAGLTAFLAVMATVKSMSKFEQGGLVGGRRHSQGGTMIEAEQGEFVMSRSAVESIGVEAMNQINQGSGTGITLNISAPLVDETVVEAIIPAIQRAQRMNLA